MVKKVTALLVTLILLIGLCIPAYAAPANTEEDTASQVIITPYWVYIWIVSTWMDIGSNGLATMVSNMDGYPGVDQITMTNRLQRYQNGSWSTIMTWTQTTSGRYAYWSKTYYVASGYNYRLHSTFIAYADYVTETTSLTSGTVYY